MHIYMTLQDLADLLYIDDGFDHLKKMYDAGIGYMYTDDDMPDVESVMTIVEELILNKGAIYDDRIDLDKQEFGRLWYDKTIPNEVKSIRMMGLQVPPESDIPTMMEQETGTKLSSEDLEGIKAVSNVLEILKAYGTTTYGNLLKDFDETSDFSEGSVLWDLAHYRNILDRHN